jgi:hypothetical protein
MIGDITRLQKAVTIVTKAERNHVALKIIKKDIDMTLYFTEAEFADLSSEVHKYWQANKDSLLKAKEL